MGPVGPVIGSDREKVEKKECIAYLNNASKEYIALALGFQMNTKVRVHSRCNLEDGQWL